MRTRIQPGTVGRLRQLAGVGRLLARRHVDIEELAALHERETARADKAESRTAAVARAARLVELGRKVRRGVASEDESAELERLGGAP